LSPSRYGGTIARLSIAADICFVGRSDRRGFKSKARRAPSHPLPGERQSPFLSPVRDHQCARSGAPGPPAAPARTAAAQPRRPAGWTVASLVRPGNAVRAPADTEVVEVHALDHAAVGEAARGADVVLHALNPSYTDWSRLALPLAYSAITAAETAGATVLFPG